MERESGVGSVSADIPGETITAHYFIDNSVIYANMTRRTLLGSVGSCSPRYTVKALLTGVDVSILAIAFGAVVVVVSGSL